MGEILLKYFGTKIADNSSYSTWSQDTQVLRDLPWDSFKTFLSDVEKEAEGHSSNFPIILILGGQYRTGLPFRHISWRNNPRTNLQNSARTNAKVCNGEGIIICINSGWALSKDRSTENGLGVLTDSRLYMIQHCTAAVKKAYKIRKNKLCMN